MGIQVPALTALGELGRQNQQAAHEICACGILEEMVQSLSHQNSYIRCAANKSLQVWPPKSLIPSHASTHQEGKSQNFIYRVTLCLVGYTEELTNRFQMGRGNLGFPLLGTAFPIPLEEGPLQLQSVAYHDRECSQAIVDTGVLEPVRQQLQTLDARVKEAAIKTLNVLVEKGPDFADLVGPCTVPRCHHPQGVFGKGETHVERLWLSSKNDTCPPQVADEATISTCVSHLRMAEDSAPQTMKTSICLMLADVAHHNEGLARRVVACDALAAVASLLNAHSTQSPLKAASLRVRLKLFHSGRAALDRSIGG